MSFLPEIYVGIYPALLPPKLAWAAVAKDGGQLVHCTLPANAPASLFDRCGPARAQEWREHGSRALPEK